MTSRINEIRVQPFGSKLWRKGNEMNDKALTQNVIQTDLKRRKKFIDKNPEIS